MKIVIGFLISLTSLFVTVGWANAAQLYVGLGYAVNEYQENSATLESNGLNIIVPGQSIDDEADSIEIHGGYHFNKYFSLELGYGKSDTITKKYEENVIDSAVAMPPTQNTTDIELEHTSINIIAEYPIANKIGVFAVLGYSYFDIDYTNYGGGAKKINHSNSDDGLTYGLGTKFSLTERYSTKLQWTRTEAGDFDRPGYVNNETDFDLDVFRVSIEMNFDAF